MRRFTELLLLATCTFLLPLFVHGLGSLHSTVKYNAQQKGTVIRGLLVTRQYYYCPAGQFICETAYCCAGGWNCCRDGSCCRPAEYCVIGSNNVIGCCPDGEICEGPAQDPDTIYPPSPQTTNYVTSTTDFTTTSTSTTTFTTLLGVPTQTVGTQIIEVSVTDIIWSENWVQEVSSCSPSLTSKSTRTAGASFTYTFQYSSSLYGYYYYYNLVNYNTRWEVFINGLSQSTYDSYITDNCTYYQLYYSSPGYDTSPSQNITLLVHGFDDSTTLSDSWSLEFNKLLISEQILPSTSTSTLNSFTQNPASPTGVAFSGAKPTQPYRPLLTLLVLVMMYYI